jgi:hypothetical protein
MPINNNDKQSIIKRISCCADLNPIHLLYYLRTISPLTVGGLFCTCN